MKKLLYTLKREELLHPGVDMERMFQKNPGDIDSNLSKTMSLKLLSLMFIKDLSTNIPFTGMIRSTRWIMSGLS